MSCSVIESWGDCDSAFRTCRSYLYRLRSSHLLSTLELRAPVVKESEALAYSGSLKNYQRYGPRCLINNGYSIKYQNIPQHHTCTGNIIGLKPTYINPNPALDQLPLNLEPFGHPSRLTNRKHSIYKELCYWGPYFMLGPWGCLLIGEGIPLIVPP